MVRGRVLKSTGLRYWVEMEDKSIVEAGIRGKIRLKGIRTTNPVSVGDEVKVLKNKDGDYLISEILPRKNYIIRKSVNLSKEAHILAANIDHAYLLVTLVFPTTHLTFINRFLVTAEAYHIPVTLLFNKIDIYSEEDIIFVDEIIDVYEKIGYPCKKISAKNKINTDFLLENIKGKQVLFAGNSGTGKSTLINTLDSSLDLKTRAISSAHLQGQHTTTFAEMYKLKTGGYVIDTPGIKSFGVFDLNKNELSHYFPEMRSLLHECKYNNCLHLNEPQCAIKEAVENETIHATRYQTYITLLEEDTTQNYR